MTKLLPPLRHNEGFLCCVLSILINHYNRSWAPISFTAQHFNQHQRLRHRLCSVCVCVFSFRVVTGCTEKWKGRKDNHRFLITVVNVQRRSAATVWRPSQCWADMLKGHHCVPTRRHTHTNTHAHTQGCTQVCFATLNCLVNFWTLREAPVSQQEEWPGATKTHQK